MNNLEQFDAKYPDHRETSAPSHGSLAKLGVALAVTLLLAACGGGNSEISPQGTSVQESSNQLRPNPYPGYVSTVYQDPSKWLCHPDLSGILSACNRNQDSTSVQADGSSNIISYQPNRSPAVDCFYLYPTASIDPNTSSDRLAGPQERQVTALQFARYGEHCRQFAPIYKQRTLTILALQGVLGVVPDSIGANAPEIAYQDILDAFRHYMANFNNGRPIVLVGHSQGSGLLRRLIAEELEPRGELLDQLVTAHLIGTNVLEPENSPVGASFQQIAACDQSQISRCIISFVTYRRGDPALAAPRFGLSTEPGTKAMCTNPAQLNGDSQNDNGFAAKPHLPRLLPPVFQLLLIPRGSGGPYESPVQNLQLSTPFYTVPDQIYTQCKRGENGASYLEVVVESDSNDPRADDYPGEFLGGSDWGLHLPELSIMQGNLIELLKMQIDDYQRVRTD